VQVFFKKILKKMKNILSHVWIYKYDDILEKLQN